MGWESSRRRQSLPANWREIRAGVLRDADGVCEIRLRGVCLGNATEVDHIHAGNDHSRSNLQAACKRCHSKKSSAEGNARQRELRALRFRLEERHPGMR